MGTKPSRVLSHKPDNTTTARVKREPQRATKTKHANAMSAVTASALFSAASRKNLLELQGVVEGRENIIVDVQNRSGETPLWIACRDGSSEIAEYLVGKGADINKTDKHGRTPLRMACSTKALSLIQLLVEMGADIDMPCHYWGRTPLWAACRNNLLVST